MDRKQMALLLGLSLALGQTAFAADHVAVVEEDGKQGVIDQAGKVILPLAYKKNRGGGSQRRSGDPGPAEGQIRSL